MSDVAIYTNGPGEIQPGMIIVSKDGKYDQASIVLASLGPDKGKHRLLHITRQQREMIEAWALEDATP